MSAPQPESGFVVGQADIVSDPTPIDPQASTGLASAGSADLLAAGLTESLGWLAMLAGTALRAPRASVMFAGTYLLPQNGAAQCRRPSWARLNKGCAPMSFGLKTS